MIEKRIQRRLDAIEAAQIVGLKRIYASLRDGMSEAKDWFDIESGPTVEPEPEKTLPPLDQKEFETSLKNYQMIIESGKKSADDVVNMLKTSYELDPDQEKSIYALEETEIENA